MASLIYVKSEAVAMLQLRSFYVEFDACHTLAYQLFEQSCVLICFPNFFWDGELPLYLLLEGSYKLLVLAANDIFLLGCAKKIEV